MIDKKVVCDRCKKNKPFVIIPKSKELPENTVLCMECANRYYALACNIKCANCGKLIANGPGCECRAGTFCSTLCAIQYEEGYNGPDGNARHFTEEDEKMLLGEDDQKGAKKCRPETSIK